MLFYGESCDHALCCNGKSRTELSSFHEPICRPLSLHRPPWTPLILAHGTSRRTEGSRGNFDRPQDGSKHRVGLLPEKPLHALRLYLLMAQDGEVAFWFQPLRMSSHCVLGVSSRPSGRCRDRGPDKMKPFVYRVTVRSYTSGRKAADERAAYSLRSWQNLSGLASVTLLEFLARATRTGVVTPSAAEQRIVSRQILRQFVAISIEQD